MNLLYLNDISHYKPRLGTIVEDYPLTPLPFLTQDIHQTEN